MNAFTLAITIIAVIDIIVSISYALWFASFATNGRLTPSNTMSFFSKCMHVNKLVLLEFFLSLIVAGFIAEATDMSGKALWIITYIMVSVLVVKSFINIRRSL